MSRTWGFTSIKIPDELPSDITVQTYASVSHIADPKVSDGTATFFIAPTIEFGSNIVDRALYFRGPGQRGPKGAVRQKKADFVYQGVLVRIWLDKQPDAKMRPASRAA